MGEEAEHTVAGLDSITQQGANGNCLKAEGNVLSAPVDNNGPSALGPGVLGRWAFWSHSEPLMCLSFPREAKHGTAERGWTHAQCNPSTVWKHNRPTHRGQGSCRNSWPLTALTEVMFSGVTCIPCGIIPAFTEPQWDVD